MHAEPLDYLPLWGLFLFTVGASYVAFEIGYAIGWYRKRLAETEKEGTVGPVVAAMLGLLAFLLAFTFSLAATRFEARRQMVVEEANAVGTTHLRAGLLAEPHRSEIRRLLDEYVTARLAAVETGDVDRGVRESEALHARLWAQAEAVSKQDPHSIVAGLFVQSLNETIDLHSSRVLIGVRSRIPFVIWLTLYLVAFLSLVELGYLGGLVGSRRSLSIAALVLMFAIVLWLIADLDRQREGVVRVSQQPLIELQQSWRTAALRPASP